MKINNIEITGITNDSRRVQAGWAFFAVPGNLVDATAFIPAARAAGAAVIVTDKSYQGDSFKVSDVRRFLAETAVQLFQPLPENIIAVTGTKGKSSVVHFCRYMLEQMGENAASIGTIGLIHKGITAGIGAAGNTTPDPILLCQLLHNLKAQGCDYAAIEASSIGLAQERVNALPIKVAAFTNFARDHIGGYEHKDMDEYFAAKKILFDEVLDADGVMVLNADDPKSGEIAAAGHGQKIISFGKDGDAIRLVSADHREDGSTITVEIHGEKIKYDIKAPGIFQTSNSMCAIGMIMGLGFSARDAARAISDAPPPAGRMQFAGSPVKNGGVYIDYAYTPDSLDSILRSARALCKGRLMLLFGAGGERDSSRRYGQGEVAEKLADVVYITDDNPRGEDPAVIRAQIASTCPKGVVITEGRAAAIRRAVADMREGDILIISGKGHEEYQIIGHTKTHFSDYEEVQKALKGN